jgi:hypothetical protein
MDVKQVLVTALVIAGAVLAFQLGRRIASGVELT